MKKKIIIISIILLIITIGILAFLSSNKLKVTLKKNRVVEINEKFKNTKFIKKIKNGKVTNEKKIKFSKLGKHKITLIIKNNLKKKEKYTYYVKVKDTIKPVITCPESLQTEEGSEIDLLKDVSAKDNSNEEIKVTVEGEYDFNKPGEYKLFYIAKDSSNNEEKKEFTLIVTEKAKPQNNVVQTDGSFTTSKGFKGVTKNGLTYIDGYLIANKTYSLPNTYNPGLDSKVAAKANVMFEAARAEGLNIVLTSGFRSYNTQSTLYNNYVNRDGKEAADTYSARPGHSEHQTGLAFDVNQINSSFDNTKEAIWLSNNCYKFGFILRYPKGKTNETGYNYESWHFRYVGEDLASKLYNNGNWITLESYFGITSTY